jgi:hypothetical protein
MQNMPTFPTDAPPLALADRFQQINQSLPDGVHFEPLDDDIKSELRTREGRPPVMPSPLSTNPAAPAMPPMPAPPVAPPSPAERFHQANRSLPDGVRYEPLDEETQAILRTMGKMPSAPPSPPPAVALEAPVEAVKPATLPQENPSSKVDLLTRIIQDERNASVFYQHLADIAPQSDFQAILREMAMDCQSRIPQYQALLESPFTPKDTPINTQIGFGQGIEMAVGEERRFLSDMAALLDTLSSDDAQNLQNLLNKRMISFNGLQWVLFRLDR